MQDDIRFLPVGPQSLLVELADLGEALALFDALRERPLPGVVEIIPAARTLMIRTAPGVTADRNVAREIVARRPAPGTPPALRAADMVELPVIYDGEDLADVATKKTDNVSAALLAAGHARAYNGGHRFGWCGYFGR